MITLLIILALFVFPIWQSFYNYNRYKKLKRISNIPPKQLNKVETTSHTSSPITPNKDLIPIMFDLIEINQYKKILRYKSLRSGGINYAPYVIWDCKESEFYYNGLFSNKVTIISKPLGELVIPYKSPCIVKIIAPHSDRYAPKIQIQDNTDILEIDYSPEAIKRGEDKMREDYRKEKEIEEAIKLNEIKASIIARKERRELEKRALQELIDEGKIFPEANKRPPIPKTVVDAVWNRDRGKCVYCGSNENLHLDHIIPFSKGGDTSVENLQLLCQKCNLEKSNKIG
ncbi:HNH endonuclease [Bacteroides thetaiotaomicron]|jgi:hypothetical protein|uniref:HNH endonuclease n=2 Tax=Bacteroides thetaiotaomicron TaxID=818 RepID=UPI001926D5CC|nr:HNH endonuclease signature motif containing protein [Bacteroides thetaiotaomicron]MCE8718154.1 HNH endonuclease [Bacteroides thetaiotaomicron]MCS2386860.1 HNH endonuclease [Bacteroides thetaiotaomicron]